MSLDRPGVSATSSPRWRVSNVVPTCTTMCGYMSKLEPNQLGVTTRKRYWFSLADTSPYLYWFKERDDVQCIGRIGLSGAAFTHDPRQPGRFTILSNTGSHVFEAASKILREEWLRTLQEARKRAFVREREREERQTSSARDILALTSPPQLHSTTYFSQSLPDALTLPRSPPLALKTPTAAETSGTPGQQEAGDAPTIPVDEPLRVSVSSPMMLKHDEPSTSSSSQAAQVSASVADLLNELGGPVSESVCGDEQSASEPETPTAECFPSMSSSSHFPAENSIFYVSADGQLNDISLEMPKTATNTPEALLSRLAESTTEKFGAMSARKALERQIKRFSVSRTECEDCRRHLAILEEHKAKLIDLEEQNASLEEMANSLKTALLVANRQIEALRLFSSLKAPADQLDYLLDREAVLTEIQLLANEQMIRSQEVDNKNRELEGQVSELQTSLEAFRESIRTKEELIIRLYEEQDIRERSESQGTTYFGDVEVPEGILIDAHNTIAPEEEAQRVFEEESVRDVNEMKDLVEGYRAQNTFLNHEIIELHDMVKALEDRDRTVTRRCYEIEAVYYQLKSRYIMVLNHFKNPEKPGKITEPGVLKELLEEVSGASKASQDLSRTDTLGFYIEREAKGDDDLLERAAEYVKKAKELTHATKLEQSEEYMRFLQSWDGFLVNSINRPLTQCKELRALVRSGVPAAYRQRVWQNLVSMSVRTQQIDSGKGYFETMLRKAKAQKEKGDFDPAIKQIDLDLARTLPSNKYFEAPTSSCVESLRRVLYAYRYHNRDVGYCQGLNRIAAIALLHLGEEDAFWFLVACVEHLQPEGYYTSTLIGAVADQKVLRDLVQEKIPKLAAHLKSMDVDISIFTLGWFLTVFIDILPHHIYLNVFDAFLYEGNKIIFRFALAILKLSEPIVLQCRTIGTIHDTLSKASEFVTDYKTLKNIAFKDINPFPTKSIESKRAIYLAQLREHGYS